MSNRLKEVIRFALTGGICFVIEFAVLVALKELLHVDTLIATPIAFLVSVAFNYALCMVWVFQGAKEQGAIARAGFLVTSVIGLFLNEGLMLLFRILLGEETVLFTLAGTPFTALGWPPHFSSGYSLPPLAPSSLPIAEAKDFAMAIPVTS